MLSHVHIRKVSKLSKKFKRILSRNESTFVDTDIDKICKIPLRKKK